jgi:hypothetical protein
MRALEHAATGIDDLMHRTIAIARSYARVSQPFFWVDLMIISVVFSASALFVPSSVFGLHVIFVVSQMRVHHPLSRETSRRRSVAARALRRPTRADSR